MSQNPTLINGFEDILTFIKQQDHRIKELEEKNKQLINGKNELYNELENKTDECEELKKELTHVQENLDEMMDFTYFKQVKKLEVENKKLKEKNDCIQRQIDSVCDANDKLKEENKALKMAE
jgi:FtsZ-binding cell division protein ZapB